MDQFKNAAAGFGAMGMNNSLNPMLFGWADWVTTVLLWTLMILAIVAIVQYIKKDD